MWKRFFLVKILFISFVQPLFNSEDLSPQCWRDPVGVNFLLVYSSLFWNHMKCAHQLPQLLWFGTVWLGITLPIHWEELHLILILSREPRLLLLLLPLLGDFVLLMIHFLSEIHMLYINSLISFNLVSVYPAKRGPVLGGRDGKASARELRPIHSIWKMPSAASAGCRGTSMSGEQQCTHQQRRTQTFKPLVQKK